MTEILLSRMGLDWAIQLKCQILQGWGWEKVLVIFFPRIRSVPAEYMDGLLTCVEFRDIEHFPPADHVLPLNVKLERIRPLPGRDELWAQMAERKRHDFKQSYFACYAALVCVLISVNSVLFMQIIPSRRCHSLCFIYDDRFRWRGEFWRLLAAAPHSKTTHRRGQEPWK